MGPGAWIDLHALRHNLRQVRRLAPNSRVLAVVKSNGYGHGVLPVAQALDEADALAVARVEEGVVLRQSGISKTVLVLEGFFDAVELAAVAKYQLDVAIQQPEQIELLAQQKSDKPISCWLKVDSGMHRLGFAPEAAIDAWQALAQLPLVAGPPRLMTHFACADDPQDPATRQQLARFQPLVEQLGAESSLANSAGIIGWPESHADWVRPGIMLYGASPMLNATGADHGLLPVMTLHSKLIAINHFKAGEPIGYGASWRCPEDMPVGVVAIGYGDGYPRHAPPGTPVLLNGKQAPLVGRVSMDMINIDLRGQPAARLGDPVILWGEGLPAEVVAERAGTIAYELFCGVTQRVHFSEKNHQGA